MHPNGSRSVKRRPTSALSWGVIAGCALAEFRTPDGAVPTGASRLYQIILSESAFLIWKLRCERRVGRGDDAPPHRRDDVHRRWLSMINDRLQVDVASTHPRFGRKALPAMTVLRTWNDTLKDQHRLPDDRTRESGRLVGIAPPEQG